MYNILRNSLLVILALVCVSTALIHPTAPFDPAKDANILYEAMDGIGTDEDAIIKVLTHRSLEQRLEIAKTFQTIYSADLVEELKSELDGDFHDLIVALMTPLPDFYARQAFNDAQPFRRNPNTAIDILAISSNAELKAIDEAYNRLKLHRSLELSFIMSFWYQGHIKNMVYKLIEGKRNENQAVDVDAAIADAKLIHDIGERMNGFRRTWSNEKDVKDIFTTRSYRQLNQIFSEYEKLYKHGIEKAFVKRGFQEDMEKIIPTMIRAIRSIPDYLAERLHEAMEGSGTNDKDLIRIIVGRSENDLDEIKKAFQRKYNQSLASMVEDDTSGDFMDALLAILAQ